MPNIDIPHSPTASKQAAQLLPTLIWQSQTKNKADSAAQQVYFSFISQFSNLVSWAGLQAAGPCCSMHGGDDVGIYNTG